MIDEDIVQRLKVGAIFFLQVYKVFLLTKSEIRYCKRP